MNKKSLEDRIAALEARFQRVDEKRRALIPDEVWNAPGVRLALEHNHEHFIKSMVQQAKVSNPTAAQIEYENAKQVELESLREQKRKEDLHRTARFQADAEILAKTERLDPSEAEFMTAAIMYERDGTTPPGFTVALRADGYKIEKVQ